MNPTYNTTPDNHDDRAALLAGLDELRRRPNRLSALIGPNPQKAVRHQLRLTAIEHAAVKLIAYVLAFHMGRSVAYSLVHRLALRLLVDQCKASLSDPATAARLKALLVQVRQERVAECATKTAE